MSTSAPTRDQTIQRLLAAETEIRQLGVRRLALIGSVARGEARPDSDLDLLVEFSAGEESFDRFMALSELLERLLEHPVESVTVEALSPFIGPTSWLKRRMSFEPREYLPHILAEADYLIGRSSGLSPETFEADETPRRAFARSLEVSSEAACEEAAGRMPGTPPAGGVACHDQDAGATHPRLLRS